MKLLLFFLYITLLISSCNLKKNSFKDLNLPNSNIFNKIDTIQFSLDSLTIPNSENIYLTDSLLYICNPEENLVSTLNTSTNKISNLILNVIRNGEIVKFSSIGIDNKFIIAIKKEIKKGFVFNFKGKILDSFLLANPRKINSDKIVTDNPLISTIQPIIKKDSIVFSMGFALMEAAYTKDKFRYVICASTNKEKSFYVNYPDNYFGKNWGGTYLRMTYGTKVNDSVFVISFPASSIVASFNTHSKTTHYINCFPNIDSLVEPIGVEKMKQKEIAIHYFQQYNFQAILYDKYRNVFYRILNKPTPIKNENSIGNFDKLILVYDSAFNYLGFSKLNSESISNTTFLIHPKGLLIQKFNNIKDEANIYFDLLSLDSAIHNKLPKGK